MKNSVNVYKAYNGNGESEDVLSAFQQVLCTSAEGNDLNPFSYEA